MQHTQQTMVNTRHLWREVARYRPQGSGQRKVLEEGVRSMFISTFYPNTVLLFHP